MEFDTIIKWLVTHSDTVVAVVGLAAAYLGWDVKKRRREFREQRWLNAATIAYRAVELAQKEFGFKGADKAKKAIQLAKEYMQAWGLSPTEDEVNLWEALWEHQAKVEKLTGGVTVDGSPPLGGNSEAQPEGS